MCDIHSSMIDKTTTSSFFIVYIRRQALGRLYFHKLSSLPNFFSYSLGICFLGIWTFYLNIVQPLSYQFPINPLTIYYNYSVVLANTLLCFISRRKLAKKRSLHGVNEHFELIFNADRECKNNFASSSSVKILKWLRYTTFKCYKGFSEGF